MEKIWLKSYDQGVPAEIDVNEYASVVEVMDRAFSEFSTRPGFHNMGKTLTYRQLDDLSARFAAYLQNQLGLKKGDRVAIMMPNLLQYPVALFGILRAGLVVVNVNPLYTARELKHQLKDSGSVAIVILSNAAHLLEKVVDETEIKHVFVTSVGDMLPFPKSFLINSVVKYVKKMVPSFNLPQAIPFMLAVAQGKADQFQKLELNHNDIAFLQYTGGTTGVSKGAILTHGNMVANMLQARAWIAGRLERGKEIVITPLPLYHVFSLTANCLVFSSIGALNVLITNPRDMRSFLSELAKWKFTAFTGVNTLFNGLVNRSGFKDLDFSHLKVTLGGGMAVQRSVAEKWKEVTGSPLCEAYGLTETSPAACINPLSLEDYNGFVGLPISSTEVTIMDENAKELAIGEAGEIAIRGPQVMQGYWQRQDETDLVMTSDGYFLTGDIGIMDESGYVKIVDRKKDMILVSGFNVYPNEVEDVIAGHEQVLEVAAIGIPHPKSGEIVKIFVVKKDPELTEESVLTYAREHLSGYKVPKAVEFRAELPKSNVGKILRKELRPS